MVVAGVAGCGWCSWLWSVVAGVVGCVWLGLGVAACCLS